MKLPKNRDRIPLQRKTGKGAADSGKSKGETKLERQKKIRSESRGIESLDAQPPKPPRQLGELREESLEQAVSRAGEEEDIRSRLFSNEEMENVDIVRADFYGCTFSECRLSGWNLEEIHFSDCVFRGCDLSNLRMEGGGFHRVEFQNCRLMGASFSGTVFDDVLISGCGARYGNFSEARFRSCRFRNTDVSEGSFGGSQFQKSAVENCRFRSTEFFHAGIAGLDFSSCSLEGAVFAVSDVKGITVSAEQAVELSKLLGIRVK